MEGFIILVLYFPSQYFIWQGDASLGGALIKTFLFDNIIMYVIYYLILVVMSHLICKENCFLQLSLL